MWQNISGFFHRIGQYVLPTASFAVLILSLTAVLDQIFIKRQVTATIIPLLILLLIAAIFCQHGNDLMERLKKLGPLEFFESETSGLLSTMQRIGRKLDLTVREGKPPITQLSAKETFEYQEINLYVSFVEFSGVDPHKMAYKQKYFELLLWLGTVANGQGDWFKAIARFERLRELSEDTFEPFEVLYGIGLSYFFLGLQEENPKQRRDYYEKSMESLKMAIEENKDDHEAYFYLGYIYDEFNMFSRAIESNQATLQLRPQYGPAKYNMAVTYTKLGKFAEAFKKLTEISKTDKEADHIFKWALGDDELKPLLQDDYWGRRVSTFLGEMAE